MKNQLLLFVMSVMFLAACNGSKKGHWNEEDKRTFYADMNKVNLTAFGEQKQAWIDAYYKKLEANYDSYNHANLDEKGCEKYAMETNKQVMSNGSVKGNWSQMDKDLFLKDMASIDLSAFGEKKEAWMQCYLSKLQAGFASYYEANQDRTGCEKAADECSKECLKN